MRGEFQNLKRYGPSKAIGGPNLGPRKDLFKKKMRNIFVLVIVFNFSKSTRSGKHCGTLPTALKPRVWPSSSSTPFVPSCSLQMSVPLGPWSFPILCTPFYIQRKFRVCIVIFKFLKMYVLLQVKVGLLDTELPIVKTS